MKSIDIFYKSYHKDYKLLYYSLKSLTKNVSGYSNVIILIPEHEKHIFDTRELPERTLIHYVPEYGNGYLYQQWCKISGHRFSNADYILFTDSDCIFNREINVQDFIQDDKPEILYTDWDKVGQAICWKQPTEEFIGELVSHERMRRNNLIYHRSTLEGIEKFKPNLEQIIMGSKSFSEFNAMSAYAWKFEQDKYNFVNTDNWEYTEPKAIQLWSLFNTGSSEVHKQEKQRAVETINQVLGLQITNI